MVEMLCWDARGTKSRPLEDRKSTSHLSESYPLDFWQNNLGQVAYQGAAFLWSR